ncbi:type II toxin-antitoxin system VapC family toxin [Methylobacterium aquaticum]|uniref:Twitching motility protein PilT n=1 Tax=Methylobacterium aquaticum TaxID=270351 RepID=A0A0J6S723_9HYPH|nr:type II toxin-antitoxin system VapC family toxin [Methylobacterium aquaticum]KMO30995.1 twitching motility protein PilT [Methylobacterium aquaticum]
MKLLLDTRALLWWLSDDPRLGDRARDRIADPRNTVLVSTASLWEIVLLIRAGRLKADLRQVLEAIADGELTLLDLRPAHLRSLRKLPDHPDPFAHLLIAQAMSEQAVLVSDDPHLSRAMMRFIPCTGPSAD